MPTNTTTGRIRMYRQGLGDCFLLRFPRANGQPFHLVIDSGVIMGTAQPDIRMTEVAEDIKRETGGKIDVLVVTHEHWDHVSGFKQAREVWKQITIGDVWMAWTEDPDPKNTLAKKLRKERAAKKAKIKTKLAALAGGPAFRLDAERGGRIGALLGFLGFSLGAKEAGQGGTKEAMDFIAGRGKKRSYYKPGTSFALADVPGVRVFVLGPPEDEKKIKKSDPSEAHPEVYSDPGHAFAFSGALADGDADQPFGAGQGVRVTSARDYDQLFKEHFRTLGARDTDWRRLSSDGLGELERLALNLDGDTNNTSLALAFELGDGRVLLFPADAQVGNWLSWQDYEWTVGAKKIHADDLFARTVLYKVGHHGSHNATLKDDGLEKMTHRDLLALVPVNKAMARKKKWKMPFAPLYQRLKEKTRGRVVLADATEPLPKSKQLTALTGTERKQFREAVTASELFIDVAL